VQDPAGVYEGGSKPYRGMIARSAGGEGMVLKPEPNLMAVDSLLGIASATASKPDDR